MNVIAFWSPTSAGASTVLKGVAEISGASGAIVGVIELNKQYSSLPQQFGVNVPDDKSLQKALQAEDEHEILRNFVRVGKHDIYLLALNNLNRIEDLHDLKDEQLSKLLILARNKFDILLLDIPPSYMELTSYQVIRKYADRVVAVIDNNLNSLDKMRRYEKFYRARGMNSELTVVMNKDVGVVNLDEIEKVLRLHPAAVLPYLPLVVKAGNEGAPLTAVPATKAEKAFGLGLQELHKVLLAGPSENMPQRQRTWAFWRKGAKA